MIISLGSINHLENNKMFYTDDNLIDILNNEHFKIKEENYLRKQGIPTLDISIDGLNESIKKIDEDCETGREILMEIDKILSSLYSKLGNITCTDENYSIHKVKMINDMVTEYENKREEIYKVFITKYNLKNDLENIKKELQKKYNINKDIGSNDYEQNYGNHYHLSKMTIKSSFCSPISPYSSPPLNYSINCCGDSYDDEGNHNDYKYHNNRRCDNRYKVENNNSLHNSNYYEYYSSSSCNNSNLNNDDDIGNIDDLKDMEEGNQEEEPPVANHKTIQNKNKYDFVEPIKGSLEYSSDDNDEYIKMKDEDERLGNEEERLAAHLNMMDIHSSNNFDGLYNYFGHHNYYKNQCKCDDRGPLLPKQPLL